MQVYQLQCPHVPLYVYFGIPQKHRRCCTNV